MAELSLRRRGRQRPSQRIPRIDWTHPYTKGLHVYFLDTGNGEPPVNIAKQHGTDMALLPSGVTVTPTLSPFGKALAYNANDKDVGDLSLSAVQSWAHPYSIAVGFFQIGTGAATTPGYFGLADPGGNDAFMLFQDSTTTFNLSFANVAGASSFTYSNNTFYTVVGTTTGATSQATWVNGVAQTPGTATSAFSTSGMTYVMGASGSAAQTGFVNANIFFGAVWTRQLSQAEAVSLWQDPYQFLIWPEDEIFQVGVVAAPILWTPRTGGDIERLPLLGRSPDEAIPFFRPSPVPVLQFVMPSTGEDRERLPPVARAPDEPPGPFFRPSPDPVPSRTPPKTGQDIERLPPIPRSPDEAIPFFRPSPVPVPFRTPPKTGEDVERLPPIPRSPDEAIPFFRPSPVPVFPFVVARTGEDVERLLLPIKSPDEPPGPFFRPSPVPVPSTIWFTPYDQPPLIRPTPVDQQGFIRPPTAALTPSVYWFAPYDQPLLLRPTPVDQQYFIKPPPVVTIPISGMAWFNPPDTRLPPVIGDPEVVQAYPPFIEPPLVPFYAQSNADDFNPLPAFFRGDGVSATWTPIVVTAVSTIAGMAWYNWQDRERPPPQARSPDENFAWFRASPVPVPNVLWFQPYPDGRLPSVVGDPYDVQALPFFVRPPVAAFYAPQSNAGDFNPLPLIVAGDGMRPAFVLVPPAPPVGISGIAWYNFQHPNPFPVITGSVEEGTTHWVAAIPPPPPLVTELHFLPFFATPGKLKAF